ncbi:MAG: LysM peptidoglycan-binding domain-containing protein [Elusimicrobiota bacterium]
MKRITLLVFIAVVFPAQYVFADFEFLGAGARPAGLGNCYTAIADDVYGIYYNPGAVAFIRNPQVGTEYSRLWLGLTDESDLSRGYMGYIHPLKDGRTSLGFSWQSFSLAGYYTENTYTAAVSRAVSETIGLGLAIKQLNQNYVMDGYTQTDPVFDYGRRNTKSVIGLDPGVLWNIYPDYFIGASLVNFNQPDIGLNEKELLPMTINVAFAYRHNYNVSLAYRQTYEYRNTFNFTLGATAVESDIKINTGMEKWFSKKTWALRTGMGFGSGQSFSYNIGASLKYKSARLDYAFGFPFGGVVNTMGTHRAAIVYEFTLDGGTQEFSSVDFEKEKRRLTDAYETQIRQLKNKILELEIIADEAKKTQPSDVYQLNVRIRELETQLKESQQRLKETQRGGVSPPGIAPQPAVEPVKRVPEKPKRTTYTVKPGDTLPSIADKFWGDTSQWRKIYEANKDKIKRGQIEPGQVLVIP